MSGHRKVTDDKEDVGYKQQISPFSLEKNNQVIVMFAVLFWRSDIEAHKTQFTLGSLTHYQNQVQRVTHYGTGISEIQSPVSFCLNPGWKQ